MTGNWIYQDMPRFVVVYKKGVSIIQYFICKLEVLVTLKCPSVVSSGKHLKVYH